VDVDGTRGDPRASALDRARIDEPFIVVAAETASVRLSGAIYVHDEEKQLRETGERARWEDG
jgi:hypothetical protein